MAVHIEQNKMIFFLSYHKNKVNDKKTFKLHKKLFLIANVVLIRRNLRGLKFEFFLYYFFVKYDTRS